MESIPRHLEFRMVSEDEAELIWSIVTRSFEEYRNSEAVATALLETVEHVKQALTNGREKGVVCYHEGNPAAAVRFYLEDGLYFRRLGVLPEYRGMGISKAIVRWLEEYAKNAGETRIWCNTRASVSRNMHLYSSIGFTLIGEKKVLRDGVEVGIATFSKVL